MDEKHTDGTADRTQRMLAAVDEEHVGSAPVGAIVARGRRERRRRVGLGVGGVVAAVAAVALGAAVLPGLGEDPSVPAAGEDRSSEDASGLPTAPDGTRWVGMAEVMVAVPTDWTVTGTACAPGSGGTVLLEPAASCGPEGRTDGVVVTFVQDRVGLDNGEGGTVYVDPTECPDPDGSCRTRLTVAGSATSIYVDSAEPEDPERIVETVRLVPEGYAAVPPRTLRTPEGLLGGDEGLAAYRATLEASGLDVDAADVGGASSYTVTPEPGTLVEEGSTVTLEPAEDQLGDAGASAGDLEGSWALTSMTGPTPGDPVLRIEDDAFALEDDCDASGVVEAGSGGVRFVVEQAGGCAGAVLAQLDQVRSATTVPGGGYELRSGPGAVLLLMQPADG